MAKIAKVSHTQNIIALRYYYTMDIPYSRKFLRITNMPAKLFVIYNFVTRSQSLTTHRTIASPAFEGFVLDFGMMAILFKQTLHLKINLYIYQNE